MSDADLPRCIPKPPFLLENRFVQPAPPNGRKQWSKRKMEPDVALALTDEYIAKIHAQPESAAGQRALKLYNVVAFGNAYDARIEKSVSMKKRYSDMCRVAVKIFGFTQREFEEHIKQFLERGVLHVKPDDKRLAPNVFLFGADLRRGTKKRRAEQLESTAASSSNAALPNNVIVKTTVQTYKLPAFLAEERFGQPPVSDGRKAWRRACSMNSDARTAFSDDTKALFHKDLQSKAAHQRFLIFNIVAFGSRFVSGISSLQANQVYYRQLVEAAAKMDVERSAVDVHLLFLLEKRILFTQQLSGTFVLTASHFLQNAPLAPHKERAQVDVYERLRLDPNAKIESPEFFGDDKYAYQFDDEHFDRESRFEIPSYDVRNALDDESLRKIDAQYDEQKSSLSIDLFNFVLFGRNSVEVQQDADEDTAQVDEEPLSIRSGANEVTFGQICRFGFDNGHDLQLLQATLLDFLERDVIKVHKNRSDNSLHMTAYPFIGTCSRVPQYERIERYLTSVRNSTQRRQLERRLRIPYEQKLQNLGDRMSDRIFNLPEDAVLDLRGRTHCPGIYGKTCIFGSDGGPVFMDTEEICKDFYMRKLRSGRYTCVCCKLCYKKHRTRRNLYFYSAYRNHTDQSMPVHDIHRAIMAMLGRAGNQCALCSGPFEKKSIFSGSEEERKKQPWQISYNIVNPHLGTRFSTTDDFIASGNIVHLACNYAQHSCSFQQTIQACKIIAQRDPVVQDIGNGRFASQLVTFVPENVILKILASAAQHGWKKEEFLPHLRQHLVTPDPMTGLSIGCGPEFDIDLAHYDQVIPLLRLSVDRINPRIDNDHISNYRIVLRIVNFVMNDFKKPDDVFERWRKNIVIQYGPNTFFYEHLIFLPAFSIQEESDESNESDFAQQEEQKISLLRIKRRKKSQKISLDCTCNDCNANFSTQALLRHHIHQHHTGERPYKCTHDQCLSAFATYTGLQQHLKSFLHTRPSQMPCLHHNCDKIFDTLAARDACIHN